MEQQSLDDSTSVYNIYLSSLSRPTAQGKKKYPFKISVFINSVPGHPRALMKMYNEVNVVMPDNTTSILQPVWYDSTQSDHLINKWLEYEHLTKWLFTKSSYVIPALKEWYLIVFALV